MVFQFILSRPVEILFFKICLENLCTTKCGFKESPISFNGQLEINGNFACDGLFKCFIYGKSFVKLVPGKASLYCMQYRSRLPQNTGPVFAYLIIH